MSENGIPTVEEEKSVMEPVAQEPIAAEPEACAEVPEAAAEPVQEPVCAEPVPEAPQEPVPEQPAQAAAEPEAPSAQPDMPEAVPVQPAWEPVQQEPIVPFTYGQPIQQEPLSPSGMPYIQGGHAPMEPPVKKEPKKPLRKRIPLMVRVLLQMLSFVLFLSLMVSLVATVLVADLQKVASADGIKTVITAVVSIKPNAGAAIAPPAAGGYVLLSDKSEDTQLNVSGIPFVYTDDGKIMGYKNPEGKVVALPERVFHKEMSDGAVLAQLDPETMQPVYVLPIYDEEGLIVGLIDVNGLTFDVLIDPNAPIQLPTDIQLPENLTDPEAWIQWGTDMLQEVLGEEAQIQEENIRTFVEESTFMDFVVEKGESLISDVANDEQKTQITADELMNLVKENKELIEREFKVELTDREMEAISANVEKVVTEGKINEKIQETVQKVKEQKINVFGTEMTMQEVMGIVNQIISRQTMLMLLGICVALALLLVLLNFYNIPGGLGWVSAACIVMGAILVAPVALLQSTPAILESLGTDMSALSAVLDSFLPLMAPNHYAVLITGGVLMVASIAWRIVRYCIRKSKAAAVHA